MGYRVIQQPATPGSVSVNEVRGAARSRKFAAHGAALSPHGAAALSPHAGVKKKTHGTAALSPHGAAALSIHAGMRRRKRTGLR